MSRFFGPVHVHGQPTPFEPTPSDPSSWTSTTIRCNAKEVDEPYDMRQAAIRDRWIPPLLGRQGGTRLRTGDGRQIRAEGVATTFDSTIRSSTTSPTMARKGRDA